MARPEAMMHALRLLPKLKRQVLVGDVLGDVSQPWPVQPLILRRERAVLHAFVTQDRARRVAVMKLRAPELTGRGWLNTGGVDLDLAALRGRVVVLDFWTFCCVNCLHVLDELRPVEAAYAEELVVIGVHSPKFEHEADPEALAAAVERYEVAQKIGAGVFRHMQDHNEGVGVCDTETCRWQISKSSGVKIVHPVWLLHHSLGLSDNLFD